MQKEKKISTLVEFTAKTLNAMKLQYDFELSNEFINELEEQNLVIVFGRGTDCVSFLGAIETDKEPKADIIYLIPIISIFSNHNLGGAYPFTMNETFTMNIEKDINYPIIIPNIPYYTLDKPNYFEFKTTIPHKKFYIWDDTNVFCEGILFSLDDLE